MRNCRDPILRRNDQNWNFSFRNYLLKYEPRIKDLISLMILILFGLPIKAGKIKLKKNKLNFKSDVSMSTVERVP